MNLQLSIHELDFMLNCMYLNMELLKSKYSEDEIKSIFTIIDKIEIYLNYSKN